MKQKDKEQNALECRLERHGHHLIHEQANGAHGVCDHVKSRKWLLANTPRAPVINITHYDDPLALHKKTGHYNKPGLL